MYNMPPYSNMGAPASTSGMSAMGPYGQMGGPMPGQMGGPMMGGQMPGQMGGIGPYGGAGRGIPQQGQGYTNAAFLQQQQPHHFPVALGGYGKAPVNTPAYATPPRVRKSSDSLIDFDFDPLAKPSTTGATPSNNPAHIDFF